MPFRISASDVKTRLAADPRTATARLPSEQLGQSSWRSRPDAKRPSSLRLPHLGHQIRVSCQISVVADVSPNVAASDRRSVVNTFLSAHFPRSNLFASVFSLRP